MGTTRATRRREAGPLRSPPVQLVSPKSVDVANDDVTVGRRHLVVTVDCSAIPEGDLRYAVGRRYVVVWPRGASQAEQRFVHLPVPAIPGGETTRVVNGVFEVTLRRAPQAPNRRSSPLTGRRRR